MKKLTGGSMHNLEDWAASGIFSTQGEYDVIVRTNAGCHREAALASLQVLIPWLEAKKHSKPLKMLDIACGTCTPFCVRSFLEGIHQKGIEQPQIYHGIDINQTLAAVQSFDFPAQIREQKLIVGNAYMLHENEDIEPPYDLIFAGLNLHHLSDQELVKVLEDVYEILNEDGLFIVHDVFRPLQEPHSYRPKERRMIEEAAFLENIPQRAVRVTPPREGYHWMQSAAHEILKYLKQYHVPLDQTETVIDHILKNDFPLAFQEFNAILQKIGFKTTCQPLNEMNPDHLLSKYFAVLSGKKSGKEPIKRSISYPIDYAEGKTLSI